MSSKLSNSFAATHLAKLYLQTNSPDIQFVFPSTGSIPAKKVPAHKLLLASASPVFKAMFNGNWNENETVDIIDSNASAFKEFLQFIYLPEVTLTIGNIEEVVRLADKHDMLDCFATCAEFLQNNLTTENMVWGYQLAIALRNAQLKKFCEAHIQMQTDGILRSYMFLGCSREVIDHILKLDTLECDEVELLNACIEWAKASCRKNGLDETSSVNIKSQLGAQFYLIRFIGMTTGEFATILQSDVIKGLFTRDEVVDVMRSQWIKEPKSEFFNHQLRSKPTYTWNATNKLAIIRMSLSGYPRYNIQPIESTWFSSNERILLGEISFQTVYCNYNYNQPTFDIEIFEHAKYNFVADSSSNKSIYTTHNTVMNRGSGYTLSLSKPILIRTNKMYEIRLQHKNVNNDVYHLCTWLNETKLNPDQIKITFHRNPSDQDSTRCGLVSTLFFNRIK